MPQTCCKSQFYRLLATCQQTATNLSISSSCNKSVKIRLVAACHLQTRYNLLKQLEASLWITSFDNQLATSLLTTCNRLVVNKLSQAIRTHPDIGLLITSLLQLARFWLCIPGEENTFRIWHTNKLKNEAWDYLYFYFKFTNVY